MASNSEQSKDWLEKLLVPGRLTSLTDDESTGVAAPLDDRVHQLEEWFLKQGLPSFVHNYSRRTNLLARVLPALVAVFIGELLVSLRSEWTAGQNAIAFVVAIAVTGSAWWLVAHLRHEPLLHVPRRFGLVEIAGFLIVPAIPPLLVGAQLKTAIETTLVNAALLALVYVMGRFGMGPMIRWAGERTRVQFRSAGRVFSRAVPLLFLFVVAFMVTSEVWITIGVGSLRRLYVLTGFFVLVGSVFLIRRVREELDALAKFETWDEVAVNAEPTPASGLVRLASREDETPGPVDLTRLQRFNLSVVIFFSQALQILIVALSVGVFMLIVLVVSVDLRAAAALAIVEEDGLQRIADFTVFSNEYILTSAHLQVAVFLALVSGLYFAVFSTSDDAYREAFREDVTQDIREGLAAREVYESATVLLAKISQSKQAAHDHAK